jgi:hypothetical protein
MAPKDEILAWHRAMHGSPKDLNKDGLPTRGLMVRYILGPRAHDMAGKLFMSSLNKIVEAPSTSANKAAPISGDVLPRRARPHRL